MKNLFIAATVLVLASMVQAVPYWPEHPDGVVYHYVGESGAAKDIVYSQDGINQYREHIYDNPDCTGGESFVIEDGTVGLTGHGYYCEGSIDPVYWDYNPPLTIVREGMQDGDIWVWEGWCFNGPAIIMVQVSDETITTPLGTMDVLHVQLQTITGDGFPFGGHLYLDQDLGPVKTGNLTLVDVDGVVGVANRSWSGVKSLFHD